MASYGSRVYGSFRYAGAPTDISVYPFTAQPLDYGSIKLSWVFPSSTSSFTSFSIVRNSMGFPVTADDGNLVYKNTYAGLSGLLGTTATMTDAGAFYDPVTGLISSTVTASNVYATTNSKTVVLSPSTSNASITVGQRVTYASSGALTGANSGKGVVGGTTVSAINLNATTGQYTLTLSDYATIPANTSLTFTSAVLGLGKTYYYSAFVLSGGFWQRVGTAIGTSIKNYNTADTMYNTLPEVYKAVTRTSSYDSSDKNVDLYNFLRTFGVQYDLIKTKVETAKNRYDVSTLDGRLIPALMDQMGFSYESGMGVQQGRRLLKHASDIYLNKGSAMGVKQLASSFTGYTASLGASKNLFLTLDCSSFESGLGFWGNDGVTSTTASVSQSGYPAPYSSTYSPTGYPNSQLKFLKLTATHASGAGYSCSFTYGVSPDTFVMSSSVTNTAALGYQYITLITDTPHGFTAGQTVLVSGLTPTYVNGLWKIISVPDDGSFTFYCPSATTSITIVGSPGAGFVNLYEPRLYGIPVTYGNSYSFSIKSTTAATARTMTLGIRWYDQYGTYLSSSSTNATNVNGYWANLILPKADVPISGAYAVPYVSVGTFANGEIHYFDAAQFEVTVTKTSVSSSGGTLSIPSGTSGIALGSVVYLSAGTGTFITGTTVTGFSGSIGVTVSPNPTSALSGATVSFTQPYQDARRVDLYLTAPRINMVVNPGFEVDATSGWGYLGTSATAVDSSNVYPTSSVGSGAANSTNSAKLTSSGSSIFMTAASIAVTPNTAYSLSAYFKSSVAISTTMAVVWKNSSGTTVRTDTATAFTLSTSAFTRGSMIPTATAMVSPSTAAYATINFTFGTSASGQVVYVDSVLFEASTSSNAYFDGNTGYFNYDDVMWEQSAQGTKGTASTGRSFYYPNRLLAQARLDAVIDDYLPMGTSHALFIGTTAT